MQVSPDGRHIDYRQAIQQVEKLFRRDFLHVRGCPGPFETSSFQALVEKEKTIAFPDNPLESVPAGSTEQEQDIRLKWVKMKVPLQCWQGRRSPFGGLSCHKRCKFL